MRHPKDIELELLLPYSPDLQPAEQLWPLANKEEDNQYAKIGKRYCVLADAHDCLNTATFPLIGDFL